MYCKVPMILFALRTVSAPVQSLAIILLLCSPAGFAARAWAEPPAAGYSASAVPRGTGSFPRLSGEAHFEIENDLTYHRQGAGSAGKRNLLFATFKPSFTVDLTESLSIESEFKLEPVEDPDPDGRNEEFENEGFLNEQLFLNYRTGRYGFRAGKFEVRFGEAFEVSSDFFGDEFAEAYKGFSEDVEVLKRVGAGFDVDLSGPRSGQHQLSFDLFASDASNFSRSLIRSQGRLRRAEGGPSNTGRLGSFALNLAGEEIPSLPGLHYHVGFVYQESGRLRGSALRDALESDDDDAGLLLDGRPQRGYVAGLQYDVLERQGLDLKLFSEFLYLDNADGQADTIRTLFTVAGTAIYREDLILGFSYARRDSRIPHDRDLNEYLLQTTVSWFRDLGRDRRLGRAGIELALRPTREERVRSGNAGLRLIWIKEF